MLRSASVIVRVCVSVCQVLLAFLDPLIQACRQSSEGLGVADTAVFMLNNVVEMQVRSRLRAWHGMAVGFNAWLAEHPHAV